MRLFRNIRDFMVHHTFIFIVFTVLLYVTICSVLYTVNFLNNIVINNRQSSESGRTYTVTVGNVSLDEKLARLVRENEDLDHVYCLIDNNGETVLADYYGHRYGRDGVAYGKWFDEDDFSEGAAKVILPNYPFLFGTTDIDYRRFEIGDTYEIGGVPYEAVGIGLLSEFVYQIPYRSIPDMSAVVGVGVVPEETGDKAAILSFTSYLEELFGGKVTKAPDVPEASSENSRYSLETVLIVGIMSMSIFNLVYIYLYILTTRKKELAVNRLSGQTLLSGVMSAYAEVFVLSSVGYVLAALSMETCLFPLLKGYGFLFADSLDFSRYLLIFILFTVLYSIVFLPAIFHQVRKSPSEALTDE